MEDKLKKHLKCLYGDRLIIPGYFTAMHFGVLPINACTYDQELIWNSEINAYTTIKAEPKPIGFITD